MSGASSGLDRGPSAGSRRLPPRVRTPSDPRVPLLELRHVAASFDDGGKSLPVLADVSLCLDDDELVAIIGPSGSGKSTLLDVVIGLIAPDAGEVRLDGAIA